MGVAEILIIITSVAIVAGVVAARAVRKKYRKGSSCSSCGGCAGCPYAGKCSGSGAGNAKSYLLISGRGRLKPLSFRVGAP